MVARGYRIGEALGGSRGVIAFRASMLGSEGFEKAAVVWKIRAAAETREAWFTRAARAACLRHSNVAQVLDFGELDADDLYLTTEYVSGLSLSALVGADPACWKLIAFVGAEVAEALEHAHQLRDDRGRLLGVVHEGVGAGRILLGRAAGVKLTGFATRVPHDPSAVGPSPEETRGEPIDGRADLFALGAALRPLLDGDQPPTLDAILRSTQARYPEHRSTASELRDSLRALLHTHGGPPNPAELAEWIAQAERRRSAPAEQVRIEPGPAPRAPTLRRASRLESVELTLARQIEEGRRWVDGRDLERGVPSLIRAIDFAEAAGCDESAAALCDLLARLFGAAHRFEESEEWRRRAAGRY